MAYSSLRILFGVLYWYIWTVLLPQWRGYRLEEVDDILDDGVTITRLVKVPRTQSYSVHEIYTPRSFDAGREYGGG